MKITVRDTPTNYPDCPTATDFSLVSGYDQERKIDREDQLMKPTKWAVDVEAYTLVCHTSLFWTLVALRATPRDIALFQVYAAEKFYDVVDLRPAKAALA